MSSPFVGELAPRDLEDLELEEEKPPPKKFSKISPISPNPSKPPNPPKPPAEAPYLMIRRPPRSTPA